jgi:hypothetical protein
MNDGGPYPSQSGAAPGAPGVPVYPPYPPYPPYANSYPSGNSTSVNMSGSPPVHNNANMPVPGSQSTVVSTQRPAATATSPLNLEAKRRIEENKKRAQALFESNKRVKLAQAPSSSQSSATSSNHSSDSFSAYAQSMGPDPLQVARASLPAQTSTATILSTGGNIRSQITVACNYLEVPALPSWVSYAPPSMLSPPPASLNAVPVGWIDYGSRPHAVSQTTNRCRSNSSERNVTVVDLTESSTPSPATSSATQCTGSPAVNSSLSASLSGADSVKIQNSSISGSATSNSSSSLGPSTSSVVAATTNAAPAVSTTQSISTLNEDECPICLCTLAFAHNLKCGCSACYECLYRCFEAKNSSASGGQIVCPCCREQCLLSECNHIRKFDNIIEASLTGSEKEEWEKRKREGQRLKEKYSTKMAKQAASSSSSSSVQSNFPVSIIDLEQAALLFGGFPEIATTSRGRRTNRSSNSSATSNAPVGASSTRGAGHARASRTAAAVAAPVTVGCTRCGRTSHTVESCFATYHADGYTIDFDADEDFFVGWE